VWETFVFVAVDTFGAWGFEAIGFVTELGKWLNAVTGEPRLILFLHQMIDFALQQDNAGSVLQMGTLIELSPDGDK